MFLPLKTFSLYPFNFSGAIYILITYTKNLTNVDTYPNFILEGVFF